MKHIILFFSVLLSAGAAGAQSLEEGARQLYYERYTGAENTYQQLIDARADNPSAWYGLITARLGQGNLPGAREAVQAAPAAVQGEPYFLVAKGAVLLHEGNTAAAAAPFEAALKETREKDAGILSAIADAHIEAKAGDALYAVSLLEKAIGRDKRNAHYHVQIGNAYRKLNDGTKAYTAYRDALDKDPKMAEALHRMGEIFLTQKNEAVYVDYFNQALAADAAYAPAMYRLYAHEFYRDPAQAMKRYRQYMEHSDPSVQNEYDLTDLLYINKQYDEALARAHTLLQKEGTSVQPRIHKLIAYSQAGLQDTAAALTSMQRYFAVVPDSAIVSKDYELMGDLYGSSAGLRDSATAYYALAAETEADTAARYAFYARLAGLAKERQDYAQQAVWLGKFYTGNDKASNLDLFNWGLAHYRAEAYGKADTVFTQYVEKYPEQSFGYYWQARAKSLQDRDMETGLAIPAYQNLIGVLQKDTTDANYKKWMVESYAYLAAYEANNQKDYSEAVEYFEKVLEVDPENEDARKYIAILEKNLSASGSE